MSIKVNGEWYDLNDFSNYDEIEAAGGIEETDDLPDGLSVAKYFDELCEYEEASAGDRVIMMAYFEHTGILSLEEATDAYVGKYSSKGKFAQEYCEDNESTLKLLPDYIVDNIDWEGVWDSYLHWDFFESDGMFFRN